MFEKGKKIVLGYLFFSVSLLGFSQGRIEGKIVDGKTREPLIGATIMIDGTTMARMADENGKYELPSVPAGTYNLTVRYVSYKTAKLENVVIENDKTTRLDFDLDAAEVQLSSVQVVSFRRTNTELSLLNSTKLMPLAVSGISAQQIAKSLDRDAGEIIKRVPGVTIQDNRFVVIRGLNQRYNNVWLNDVSTPSSESDSRAFSFDVIPGGLIDHMMVYKSPAPEIPADFSGGFVKIYTKNMPESNSFQFSLSSGYQQGSTFETFVSGSRTQTDLIGFGYSARALPNGFPSKISSSMSKADLTSYTENINAGWGIREFSALPDIRASLVYNRIFNWNSVKIGTISAINYSNVYRSYDMVNKRYGIYQQTLDAPYARNDYQDSQYNQESKFGILHNWSFVFDSQNRLEFRNFFNQIGKNRYTYREGEDNNNDYTIKETEIMYTSRTTYSGQLSGKHRFSEDQTKLDWVAGYSYANRYEPDRKIITARLNDDATSPYYNQYGIDGNDVKRNYQNLDEHAFSGGASLEQQFNIGDFSPLLKAGLLAEYKNRSFAARNFIYTYNTALLPAGLVYSDYKDIFTTANVHTQGILLKENTNKSDSYTADNQMYAGYVGLNMPLATWAYVYAGVRMESNRVRLHGYDSDGTDPVKVDRQNLDLFPSVNSTLHLNEYNQIRMAYGRSVNRPEFREIAPYVYYDFEQFSNFEGNSSLEDAYIQNVDMRYEYFPTPSEVISLAVFYKHFQKPIEVTYFEVGGQQQYTYQNAKAARNYGVELDVRKNLNSIGLKNFNLVMNGTLIQSKVFFDDKSFERDRAMQGQSPWLINTGLYYDNAESGWKGSLLYNSIGKRIAYVGIVNQDISEDIPDVYEMPRNVIDISLSKKIGEKLELNIGAKDILNEPVEFKQFPQFTDKNGVLQKREQTTRSYLPGRNFSLSLTARF